MLKVGNTRNASSARRKINGIVSRGATWADTLRLSDDGAQISGADSGEWRLTLRKCGSDSIDLTLSTVGATLVVTQSTTYTQIAIDCPASSLSSLCGDYHADLGHESTGGDVTHWAHGTVTITEDPVWS